MKKTIIKKTILIPLVFCLLFCTGIAGAGATSTSKTATEYAGLEKQIHRLLENKPGTYGIYIIDIKSGKSLGINHMESFHGASTFKLPMNLYLYQKIAAGDINPQTMLTYRQEHYEGGTGKLQFQPVGNSYSIKMLSRYSIIYSDNVATNILLNFLGRSNVKNFMRSLGGTMVDNDKNVTCPRDMAIYMEKLLRFNSQHPETGKELLSNLQSTIFNDRIPKLLPPHIRIAHKIGNWPPTETYNDVGYVEHPERPYIISMFSKNTGDMYTAFSLLQQISKITYDYQGRLAINLLLNGCPLTAGPPPLLENGRVLVPLRALAEAMSAEVSWDGTSRNITITKNRKKITLQLNSNRAIINGDNLSLAIPPRIIDGHTMIPLRFISQSLGAGVNWNHTTKTVSVII